MEGRKQFTFYRSYYEAIKKLSARRRLGVLEAVIAYGLDGTEPESLDAVQEMAFKLIRPTLDAGHRMAAGGRRAKVSKSLPKGMAKEGEKEKENEIETEIENEIEIENETETERYAGAEGFDAFWDAFPDKVGKEAARKVWRDLRPDAGEVLEGLRRWKKSVQWSKDGGRYVSRPAKFLRERMYLEHPQRVIPKGADGELGAAELEAIEKIRLEG